MKTTLFLIGLAHLSSSDTLLSNSTFDPDADLEAEMSGNFSDANSTFTLVPKVLGTRFLVQQEAYHTKFLEYLFHNDTHDSYFNITLDSQSFKIISESVPVLYKNTSYYWNSEFFDPTRQKWECNYEIGEEDDELNEVLYPNGSKVTNLIYGCPENTKCCGLRCCPDLKVLYSILLIIIFVMLFIMNRCCERHGCCQYDKTSAVCDLTPIRRESIAPISAVPTPTPPPLDNRDIEVDGEQLHDVLLSIRTMDPAEVKSMASTIDEVEAVVIVKVKCAENFDNNNDNSPS